MYTTAKFLMNYVATLCTRISVVVTTESAIQSHYENIMASCLFVNEKHTVLMLTSPFNLLWVLVTMSFTL